jgi:hypothetical protein
MVWGRGSGFKYGNIKVHCKVLGTTVSSKWEHDLYHMLLQLQIQKEISGLIHQAHYDLFVNETKICRLELDYEFNLLNKKIYVDAKSPATAPSGFLLKAKLFSAIYEQPIYLVQRKKLGLEIIVKGSKMSELMSIKERVEKNNQEVHDLLKSMPSCECGDSRIKHGVYCDTRCSVKDCECLEYRSINGKEE